MKRTLMLAVVLVALTGCGIFRPIGKGAKLWWRGHQADEQMEKERRQANETH